MLESGYFGAPEAIYADRLLAICRSAPPGSGGLSRALFVNAPEAMRTPDARLGKERFWDYRNFQPLCGFCFEISMLTAVACLWYLLVSFGKIGPQMKTFGQQKGCGCGSFIKAVMVKIVCKTDKIFQLVIAVYCKLVYTHS